MTAAKQNKSTPEILSEALRELLPYTNLGWQLVASMLFFFGTGYGIDYLLETGSVFTIIFAVIGIIVGLASVIKSAHDLQEKQDRKKQERNST